MKQTTVIKAALLAATALTGVVLARPAAAQSASQIQTIEQQIRALQAELAKMKADAARRDEQVRQAQQQAAEAQAQQQALAAQMAQAQAAPAKRKLPLGTFQVGGVTVTLGGFAAGEGIYRSKNQAASIDTGFNGNIPFRNNPNYYIPEYRETAQQSRFALLARGNIDNDQSLTSYMETDFLSAGSSSNNNQSNSYTLRLRQFWGSYDNTDLGVHVLAGQAWSMATLYKVGLVPRQENVPLTIDAQYVVGFDWARQAAFRVTKDFDDHKYWLGLSLEEPSTTLSAGAQNCFTSAYPTAANGNTIVNATCGGPNVNSVAAYPNSIAPDIIVKAAADPGYGHYEVYGLVSFFQGHVATPAGSGSNNTTTGEGIGAGMVLPLIPKKLEFQASGLWGSGVGRYGTGQLPDTTVDTSGKLEPLTEGSVLFGLVGHPTPNVDVYLYGGAEEAQRKWYTAGKLGAGYGPPATSLAGCYVEFGSCSAATEGLLEGTIGAWWRVFKGDYGTAQVGAQYEYIQRTAFSSTVPGKPGFQPVTNENAFLVSLRYLPFQ